MSYSGIGAVQVNLSPVENSFATQLKADQVPLGMMLDFCEQIRTALQAAMAGGSLSSYAGASTMLYGIGTAMIRYAAGMDTYYTNSFTFFPADHAFLYTSYVNGKASATTWLTSKLPATLLPSPLNTDFTNARSVTVLIPQTR
jgi:hypothetical protein